jgi:hypothetical protein
MYVRVCSNVLLFNASNEEQQHCIDMDRDRVRFWSGGMES